MNIEIQNYVQNATSDLTAFPSPRAVLKAVGLGNAGKVLSLVFKLLLENLFHDSFYISRNFSLFIFL